MTDLTNTITPKSDQLNADDLILGPITITVTGVKLLSGEQPVSMNYVGDNGKPYKPCKSMRRVLVTIWGSDGNEYIGRSMTLYNDESVTFGREKVGGIRISHMSHIEQQVTLSLTVSKARRKPYTVNKLIVENDVDMRAKGIETAKNGTDELKKYWESLSVAQKHQMKDDLNNWKQIANDKETS